MATTKKTQALVEKLESNATKFMVEEQKLLKKHGLNRRLIITFPQHSKVPMLGIFAVWLLKKSKAVLDTEFGLLKK